MFGVEPVGAVHVWDKDSGKEVGVIRPGPEVGSASGWVDVPNGISARQAQPMASTSCSSRKTRAAK